MMPKFSNTSLGYLCTCHPKLQRLFLEVIRHVDCSVICGHRNEAEQTGAFNSGKSQVEYPNSKHNQLPSMAVDVIPYPFDWKDREKITYFAGIVKGIAIMLEIPIRWGGDWNSNFELADNRFDDLPHFELMEES